MADGEGVAPAAAALERAFRDEWTTVVAGLSRRLGDLQAAEDAVAEAFTAAATAWRRDGVPPNPGAWLTLTAWRKAVDQLRRDRHDYDSFAPQLKDAGYNVIAIDVRGHGESSGDLKSFTEADFQKIGLDIAAAKQFLGKKADTKKLVLIGESFSANAAINYAATDPDVVSVIAISPGLDFRGIGAHVK